MDKNHERLIKKILSNPQTPEEYAAKAEIERLRNKPEIKSEVKSKSKDSK